MERRQSSCSKALSSARTVSLALARDGLFVAGREGKGRDVCRYCECKIVCDAARNYLSDEKWAAPEAARLLELREIT